MTNEYPKCLYHPEREPRIVIDAEEEAALGAGWADSPFTAPPAAVDTPAAEAPAIEEPSCESCSSLRAEIQGMKEKFNTAWQELLEENEALQEQNQALLADNGVLREENQALRDAQQHAPTEATEMTPDSAEPAPAPEVESSPKKRRK